MARLMVLGLMVGAKADEYLERTEPGEFRVLEVGASSSARCGWTARPSGGSAGPCPRPRSCSSPPRRSTAEPGMARLLAGLLDELHGDGVPLATLTPSTFPFYRGAGFEVAGSWTMYEARSEHLPRDTAPYRARPVSWTTPPSWPRSTAGSPLPARRLRPRRPLLAPAGPASQGQDHRRLRARRPRGAGRLGGGHPRVPARTGALPDPGRGRRLGLPARRRRRLVRPVRRLRLHERDGHLERPRPRPGGPVRPPRPLRPPGRTLALDAAPCRPARRPPGPPLAVRGDRRGRVPGRGPGLSLEQRHLAPGAGRRPGPGRPAPPSTRAATADVRGLASLFTGFAGPDDLLRAGLLAGFDQDAVDLLRAAFASPRPWTAEFY